MNEKTIPVLLDDGWESSGATAARAFVYALFKRWRLVVGTTISALLVVVLAAWLRPAWYHSTARILVKSSRAEWQITPTDASRITSITVNDAVLNTEISIIKSNELLAAALARLDPTFGEQEEQEKLAAVAGLRRNLRVFSPPQSNIIEITHESGDPTWSAKVVNTIADVYLARHSELHNNAGLVDFYTEQASRFKREWEMAEQELKEFMASRSVVNFDDEISTATKLMHSTEIDLGNVRNKIVQVEKKIKIVQAQFDAQPEKVAKATEVVVNPTVLALEEHLVTLENQRTALLQKFTEEDRRVQDKEAEIAAVKARIASEKRNIVGKETTARNEVRQELERRLLTFKSQIRELRIRARYLNERVGALRARVETLQDARMQYTGLQQAAGIAKEAYAMAQRKLDEARLAAAMDKERILNVAIAEAGTVALGPDNAPDGVTFAMALVLGLGLGVGAAAGLEFLRRAIKFEQDVERYLESQVLAVIPDLRQQVAAE